MTNAGWRMTNAGWRMTNAGWRMTNAGWQMTNAATKRAIHVSRVPESGWPLPLENAKCGIRNGEWGRRNGR